MTWTAIGTDVTIDSVSYRKNEEFGETVTVTITPPNSPPHSIEFYIEDYKPFGERIQNLPTVEQLRKEAIKTDDGVHALSELEMKRGKVEGEVKTDGK